MCRGPQALTEHRSFEGRGSEDKLHGAFAPLGDDTLSVPAETREPRIPSPARQGSSWVHLPSVSQGAVCALDGHSIPSAPRALLRALPPGPAPLPLPAPLPFSCPSGPSSLLASGPPTSPPAPPPAPPAQSQGPLSARCLGDVGAASLPRACTLPGPSHSRSVSAQCPVTGHPAPGGPSSSTSPCLSPRSLP